MPPPVHPTRATRVGGRSRPSLELVVEVEQSDGSLAHQRVALSAPALLGSEGGGAEGDVARCDALGVALQERAPTTLGLVPRATLARALTALAASLRREAATLEDSAAAAAAAVAAAVARSTTAAPPAAAPPAAASALELVAAIGDLQRVGPAALQAAKSRMDTVFVAHRLAPGDPGFVYDKRAEFEAVEPSDWD